MRAHPRARPAAGKPIEVAIKCPKVDQLSTAQRTAFVKEMATLAQLQGSAHVLKEIAVVVDPLLIIMELSNQGSIKM